MRSMALPFRDAAAAGTAPEEYRLPSAHGAEWEGAVVIGASIAGLCAARVLSDFYDRVTVFERDDLPATPANRPACRKADMSTC